MKACGTTDTGRIREINEDDYCVCRNKAGDWLAIVCDGIGGSQAGEVASRLAVKTVYDSFMRAGPMDKDWKADKWIRTVLNSANDLIYSRSARSIKVRGMGTTAVGCLVTRNATYIFNVGDSRLYALYKDGFIQMTEDHSVTAQMVRTHQLSAEEAKTHKDRNTLTNALGVWKVFRVDINKIDPNWKMILVCSDGLHGYVEEKQIEETIRSRKSLRDKAAALVNLADEEGGHDNVTVVLLEREFGHA
jgi:protein phosphatase